MLDAAANLRRAIGIEAAPYRGGVASCGRNRSSPGRKGIHEWLSQQILELITARARSSTFVSNMVLRCAELPTPMLQLLEVDAGAAANHHEHGLKVAQ